MTCHLGSFAAMQPVRPNVNFTLTSQPIFRCTCCTTADNLGPKYVSPFKNWKILSNETKKKEKKKRTWILILVLFQFIFLLCRLSGQYSSVERLFFLSSIFSSKPKGGIPLCFVSDSVYFMLFRPARKLLAAKKPFFAVKTSFHLAPREVNATSKQT